MNVRAADRQYKAKTSVASGAIGRCHCCKEQRWRRRGGDPKDLIALASSCGVPERPRGTA
jgi:hypothetical protein